MIYKCKRCDKDINSPDASNADYIIAPDCVVQETRKVYKVKMHNEATLAKQAQVEEMETKYICLICHTPETQFNSQEDLNSHFASLHPAEDMEITSDVITKRKYPDLVILDSEYTEVEEADFGEAQTVVGMVKVLAEAKEVPIQKTAIICPECYNAETDTVIWGVHK